MAVTAVIGSPSGALNYTFTTDTSADWASVANSTYFYDKADKLVHFKNASGTVLEIFSAAGGGGGLTIGTTAITSGVVGRVLFEGTGNVAQEDANFTYDTTLKKLTLKAAGTASTDIPFSIRNSADTRNILTIKGDKTFELLADTPATNGGISITANAYNEPIINAYNSFGNNNLRLDVANTVISLGGNGTIKIGAPTATNSYLGLVTPTTNNRFLKLVDGFNNEYLSLGGNAYDGGGGISLTLKTTTTNNSNFVTFSRSTNTNPFVISDQAFVGIGTATPAARLDIRAQGALSTDVTLRIRNSADTLDILQVLGNRSVIVNNPSTAPSEDIFVVKSGNGAIRTRADAGNGCVIMYSEYSGYGKLWEAGDAWTLNGVGGYSGYFNAYNSFESNPSLSLAVVGSSYLAHSSSNLIIGAKTVGTSGTGVFSIKSGTAPTTSPVDQIQLYSAAIVAGNAAPHFRTENGNIIKLYKQDLPTNPTTSQIADFLKNLGLANLI